MTGERPWTLYLLYDGDEVLYVGITEHGPGRFNQHWRNREWWPRVTRAEFEHHPSKKAAAARERELIRALEPAGNKQGNPGAVQRRSPRRASREVLIVYIDSEVKEKLQQIAEEEDRSVSQVARRMIEEAVEKR